MLVIGLGNPGDKYARNRHNIGFIFLDALAEKYDVNFASKFNGLYGEAIINEKKIRLLKPQTYMNNSGESVVKAKKFFDIADEDVVVVYDDLDVPFSKIKIKTGGGHGGHNGLRSLDSHIGKEYQRIRFGIDHPGHKDKVHGYVLSDFSKKEAEEVAIRIQEMVDYFPVFIEEGREAFLNKLGLIKQEEPKA